jgi:hypothetical protein
MKAMTDHQDQVPLVQLAKHRQIIEALALEIEQGRLKPSDRLPSEKELCQQWYDAQSAGSTRGGGEDLQRTGERKLCILSEDIPSNDSASEFHRKNEGAGHGCGDEACLQGTRRRQCRDHCIVKGCPARSRLEDPAFEDCAGRADSATEQFCPAVDRQVAFDGRTRDGIPQPADTAEVRHPVVSQRYMD